MNIGNIKYLLKEGVRNLWTNRLMTLASVGVLTACLMLVGYAMLFSDNVNSIVGYIEDQNEMVVFLEKENTEEENLQLMTQIQSMSDVEKVEYITEEEAWEIQKEKLGEAAALLEENGDNPYYAYFTVREKDLSKIDETATAIEALEGIKQVNSSKGFANSIIQLR
ncbi:MAG: permease-like cell division protein FtsX, partial [Oscillospiraceae bacterium]|nr:permease-like cell division protein FtsX [Oscillospiraceae bacterium]